MSRTAFDTSYDVVIIGAGPAGLNACLHVLKSSPVPKVLLVDKMVPWEHPIPCAEAAGRLGFTEAILPQPSWIRHSISQAAFHSPDGTTVTYRDANKGYILDRARMQRDMAERCESSGAHVVLDVRVTDVSKPGPSGVRAIQMERGRTTGARVVIDASGPLSSIGKGEGIEWKPIDLEPSYFALLEGVEHNQETVDIYVGRDLAPDGYAWAFPNEGSTVNAGVVVGKSVSGKVNIRRLLDNFIKMRLPGGKVLRYYAGSIPCGYHRGALAVNGLLKAGDAASTINPISRAGNVEALMCGGLAGDYSISMLGCQTSSEMARLCREYEQAWFDKRGRRHQKLSRVKADLARIPDADYNSAAHALAEVPPGKLTMGTIFRKAVGRFPKLVWAMRHLM
jgi:digeranylgeranylglycerophospholipid reductase